MIQLYGSSYGALAPEGLNAAAIAFATSASRSPPIASPMMSMKMPVAISMMEKTRSWRASSNCA